MNTTGNNKPPWMRMAIASIVLALGSTGCITGTQFRSAALPSLESGVNLILDGVVNGLFAAIAVEPNNDSTGTS